MKLKGKSIVAILLTLVFSLSIVCVTAFATGGTSVPVTSITVAGGSKIKIGETTTLTATVKPDNATKKDVTWSSSDSNVATVNGGVVSGVTEGTAVITAKATDDSGATGTLTVTVTKGQDIGPGSSTSEPPAPPSSNTIPVQSISIKSANGSDTIRLKINNTAVMTAEVSPANATNRNVTWTSSDESVVRFNQNSLSAVGAGQAIITAYATDGSGISGSMMVVVTDDTPVTSSPSRQPASSNRTPTSSQDLFSTGSQKDPEINSQDWGFLLSSGAASGSSSSKAGGTTASGASSGTSSGGGGTSWILVLGISLIVLALAGIGVFIYLQFVYPKRLASREGLDDSESPDDDTNDEPFTDISSHMDTPQPQPHDRSIYTTADIDIPLDDSPAPSEISSDKTMDSAASNTSDDFDWDKFFEENDPHKK